MKIDNNLFLFMLQKKKKGGMILPVLLTVVLLAGVFAGGLFVGRGMQPDNDCDVQADVPGDNLNNGSGSDVVLDDEEDAADAADGNTEELPEGTYITSSRLASMTKEKYENEASPYGYVYGDALTGISREDDIVLQAGCDVRELGIEYWTEVVALYQDPELKYTVSTTWAYDDATKEITISPGSYPTGKISLSGLTTDFVRRFDHDDLMFFPHDAGTVWGNLGTMYMAVYIDLETGEKLDVPQVHVVTVKGELEETPRLQYSYTEDGRIHFTWSAVTGAEEYLVCRIDSYDTDGLSTAMYAMDHVTGTEWTSPAPEFGALFANEDFKNFWIEQDDWYSEYDRESRIEEYGEEPIAIPWNTNRHEEYCVIAIASEGSSMMSNRVDSREIEENIPVKVAYDTWRANGYNYQYLSVEELPAYGYVTLANGMTATKLINYDTENAVAVEDRYILGDEEGNYLEGKNVNVLNIPYQIEGTPFEDVMIIYDYKEENLTADIMFIEEREDMLRKNAGEITPQADIEFDDAEQAATEVREIDFEITANSALSEYLAQNMLSGVTVIDISEFPEAADADMLSDALLEAYYQNPLILGVTGYRMNNEGTAVKVMYEETPASAYEKQEEIKEKVSEITAEIITPGMTELEKELAINEYLINTCEYDDDALENAEENDFYYVDEEFNDSFTAYGALVNGKCVCAGYAAAFKLLADAAGLECVVVTGTLEGNLPHAWNKVRIDGEWEILDVTNNDNEFMVNALLNLPEEAGRRTLTEDSDYVLDGYMRNYVATNGQREYYRLNDKYFSYDEIGEKLAEQINEKGEAVLRTEYALDDDTFERIGQDVYAAMEDEDADLYGYYWMGVIYLTTEE